ncbi:unnamed protein product [Brassica oleracea var. botrytis]
MFNSTAPCSYEECTRGERSRRRVKCKHLVSNLRKRNLVPTLLLFT